MLHAVISPIVGDVGVVLGWECTPWRQTDLANYTLMHSNVNKHSPNNPPTTPKYSQSIQEVIEGIRLVADCTPEQRWTVHLEYVTHHPALLLK